MLDQILNTAKDIVLIGSAQAEDKVVFAFPFEGEVAKRYFDKTFANLEENKVDGFNRTWEFDAQTGLIKGSSTFLILRLDEAVRPDGLWVPTPEQAMFLDKKGRLSNRVYRDYGMAVYSDGTPNQEVAREIIKQAKRNLPLIAPFKNLVHRIDKDFPYGIAIALTENPIEIKSGKQAIELLDKFYKGDTGACRLGRVRYGGWLANLDGLDFSFAYGRVDWMCAEGTRADLVSAYKNLLERQYDTQIQKLTNERDKKQEAFASSLESLE